MRYKIFGIIVLAVSGVLVVGLAIFYAGLPFLAQRVIENRYQPVLKAQNMTFQIQHVGLTRTLVSDLHLGKDISADLAGLTYDPQGFNLPAPGRLTISGLHVKALYDPDQGVVIDGLFPGSAGPSQTGGSRPGDVLAPATGGAAVLQMLDTYLSFLPEQVVFNNGKLTLTLENKTIQVPFEITISLNKGHKTAVCNATFYLFGHPVTMITRMDIGAGIQTFKLAARSFDVRHLADFLPPGIGPVLTGTTDLEVEKRSHNNWQISLSKLHLSDTGGLQINNIFTQMLMDNNQISILGKFGISHPQVSDLSFSGRAVLALDPSGSGIQGVDLVCESHPLEMLTINQDNIVTDLGRPLTALSVKMTDRAIAGNLVVSFSEAAIRREDTVFSLGQGSVKSDIQGDLDKGLLACNMQSHLSGIRLKTPDSVIQFRRMDTAGTVSLDMKNPLHILPDMDFVTELMQGSVSVPASKILVQGISARLPVIFPDTGGTGRFSVEKIMVDNRTVLGGEGKIHRTGPAAIAFDGTMQVPDTADLAIGFNGTAGMAPTPHLRVEADVKRRVLSSFQLEKFMPRAVRAADYDLDMTAAGYFSWKENKITTGADLIIHGGKVTLPDLNMTAAGIRGRIAFSDLLATASFPGQVVTVDSIRAGDFYATDAKVRVTLETGGALLLENVRANWCNGLVSMESVRFPSPDGSVSVTLYCDRIQLNELLKQMGGFQSRGKGTLNGRIPVRFKDGDISFENGFLFSTPGQGGHITINNTQKLVAGIPVDSPQFVQLDLAREALKDFEYTWAKLTFNTQKDTLSVNMELDGKPGRLLPFVYKKEVGSFVRVDAQSPGSHFQGITLDVNLTLPFNQVIKFGNKIQKLLQ
jgi:hypothetical protein